MSTRSTIADRAWLTIRCLTLVALGAGVAGCGAEQTVRARAAADFHCSEREIQITELPGRAYVASGCGESATYSCTTAQVGPVGSNGGGLVEDACIREADGPSEPISTPPPPSASALESTGLPPAAPFPGVALGFTFGMKPADAEAECTRGGRTFAAGADGASATCTKEAANDAPHLDLRFCGDALCSIEEVRRAPPAKSWVDGFVALRESMTTRFGHPTKLANVLPDDCGTRVVECMAEQRAAFFATWRWSSGDEVRVAMGSLQGAPAIRTTFARAESHAHAAAR